MQDPAASLIQQLTVGLSFSSIYFREHPRVIESSSRAVEILRGILPEDPAATLFVGTARGRTVVDGKVHVGPSLIADRLILALDSLHAGGVRLSRSLEPAELVDFFAFASDSQTKHRNLEASRTALASRGIRALQLSPRFGEPGWLGADEIEGADDEPEQRQEGVDLVGVYRGLYEVVQSSHDLAVRGEGVALDHTRATVQGMLGALQESSDELLNLARYPSYDSYTIGHSVRVSLFALIVAKELGANSAELTEIGTAALLHDVGKSRIPSEILFKPSRLSEEELQVMRTHPLHGAEILLETEDSSPWSIGAAFGHHLRADGRGYPDVPDWMPRTPATNLINVCDVFEALTAVRPYKPSLTPAQAYEIMLADPGAYDPDYLAAFVRTVGLYPPGSRVRLSSGEVAQVMRAGPRVDRPIVRVLLDADGNARAEGDRPDLDLASAEHAQITVSELELADESVVQIGEADHGTEPVVATH